MFASMHELSLAQSLVEQILEAASAEGATHVTRVVVAMGPYSGVDKSAFEFAFPIAAEGTLMEGAALVIEDRPATIDCSICHTSAPAHPSQPRCPHCGSDRVTIKGGHEFLIREVELHIAED